MFRWFKWKFKWICEYCGNIVKRRKKPQCIKCSQKLNKKVRMIKIDKD